MAYFIVVPFPRSEECLYSGMVSCLWMAGVITAGTMATCACVIHGLAWRAPHKKGGLVQMLYWTCPSASSSLIHVILGQVWKISHQPMSPV